MRLSVGAVVAKAGSPTPAVKLGDGTAAEATSEYPPVIDIVRTRPRPGSAPSPATEINAATFVTPTTTIIHLHRCFQVRHVFSAIITLGAIGLIFYGIGAGYVGPSTSSTTIANNNNNNNTNTTTTTTNTHYLANTHSRPRFPRDHYRYAALPGHPTLLYIIFFSVLILLAYLEGLQVAILALEHTNIDGLRERYPRAHVTHALSTAYDGLNVQRFLVGRQFFVVFVVFLCAQLTTYPELPKGGVPGWLFTAIIETGLPGALVVLAFGQLMPQVCTNVGITL